MAGDSGPGNGHRTPKEHDEDEGEDGHPLPWIISGTGAKPGLRELREGETGPQCPRLGWDHQWLLDPVLSWDSAVPRP